MKKLIGLVVLVGLYGCSESDGNKAVVTKATGSQLNSSIKIGALGAPFCSDRDAAQTIADGLLLSEKDWIADGASRCELIAPETAVIALGSVEGNVIKINANGADGYTVYTRTFPPIENFQTEMTRTVSKPVRICADWSDAYMAHEYTEHSMVEKAQNMSGCKTLWEGTTVKITGVQGENYLVPATHGGVLVNAFVAKQALEPLQVRKDSSVPEL